MKKLLIAMSAIALMALVGCSKSSEPSDPTKEVGPVNKQWSFTIAQPQFTEHQVTDLSTPGTLIIAYNRDEGAFTITLETAVDSIKYGNDAKTAGVIYYKNKLGNPASMEFKDASDDTCIFVVGGLNQTWNKSNYTLK